MRLLLTAFFLIATQTLFAQGHKHEGEVRKEVLHLFPDTAKTYVNIYVSLPQAKSFSLSIYDYRYQSWIKEVKVVARKDYQYSLDVTKLENGKYKVHLTADSEQYDADFVVRR